MIFLSAGIPQANNKSFDYGSVDVIAVREAVKSLTMSVIPNDLLVWGGHPSITPMIRFILDQLEMRVIDHVILYQSLYFEGDFIAENDNFEKIILTRSLDTKESSLELMRKEMLSHNNFAAGVFIGGDKGVEREFELFRRYNPKAMLLPLASTGGAAEYLYKKYCKIAQLDNSLLTELSYINLFKRKFKDLRENQ